MIQIETINQFEGWGNDTPQSPNEHFYSKGFSRSGMGVIAGGGLYSLFSSADFASIGTVLKLAKGIGRDYPADTVNDYLFAGDNNGYIYQSDLGISAFEIAYRVSGQTWSGAGMMVDQKTRLLYSGERYLGMFDSSVANYLTGTVSMTNGSPTVTGSGTTFVAGDVGKTFRIIGENTFYRISAYTSATSITLSTNYAGATGSGKTFFLYRAWDDTWKDFGSSLSAVKSPMEVYEDTVLIMRNNNVVTLNTLTDTITTDASPAFSMPTGYIGYNIVANVNGILMAYNFQGRGVLVLWDNYSDRSIAPWIRYDDSIIGMQRYGSGWIVMTTKALHYTNGYSSEILTSDFLYSTRTPFGGGTNSNFLIIGDNLFFGVDGTYNKRRGGLYRINLKTKLVSFFGALNDVYDSSISSLFYSSSFSYLYAGSSLGIGRLVENDVETTKTYSLITNEIGSGENWKVAEALRIPIAISNLAYSKQPYTFTLSAKINILDRQLYNKSQTKSSGSTTTTMVVDETSQPIAEAGDEIEFLDGVNKGKICHIASITGSGTATATYTLDRTLTNTPTSFENFNFSGFKQVGERIVSNVSELPNIYFGIKNRYKGKKFMIKFVVTNASVPIEIKPFQFVYDDLGGIE